MHVAALVLAPWLWLGSLQVSASDPCARCDGAGWLPCAEHRASDLALERNAIRCTFYAGCALCDGTGRADCPACEPAVDDAARARLELVAEVEARVRKVEAAVGRPVVAAANRHFSVVCELEPMKAEHKKRGRHELAHLYLDRLEEVQRSYLECFGLEESALPVRSEVLLWASRADHERAGQALCGYKTQDPEYMRGLEAVSSIWLDPKKMEDDPALHRNVVHHAVHGFMNLLAPATWTGKLHMGWADEGLSLWFEDRLLGAATGFCFWPEEEPRGLKDGNWRPVVRRILERETPLDLERLLTLDTVDMTREQHGLGFGLIDFLARRDAARLDRLLASLRARTPARDAFKEVYDLSLEELESSWRAWVERTYPKR